MNKPGSPALRRSGNSGRHSAFHLGKQRALQVVGVSHKSFSVRVFLGEVLREIRVVGVGHPMERILPRPPMGRYIERDFLWDRRGLRGRREGVASAEGGEEGGGCVGDEEKREGQSVPFD
jgi:hypothetical protein